MSKSLVIFAYLFFTVTTFAVNAYAQSSGPEKVLSMEKQRFLAMLNKDTAFLDQVLADDLLYCHTTGKVDTKQSFIRSIAERTLDYKKMDLQETSMRSYKNTVIINGKMHIILISKSDNQQLDFTIKYLDVYRKKGKNWKLVAWQSARLPVN
jgi:Domain of unknown function (DUF4440)